MFLSVYADNNNIVREILLPGINNQDHEVLLKAGEYRLKEDVLLLLEVIDGSWRFRRSEHYRVDCRGRSFEGSPLKGAEEITITTYGGEVLMLLVWDDKGVLPAYRKYYVDGDYITVGRMSENDISYNFRDYVSRQHFIIRYAGNRAFVSPGDGKTVYKNHKKERIAVELRFGDEITLFGLSIICLGRILAVRSLNSGLKISGEHLRELAGEPDELSYPSVGRVKAPEVTVGLTERVIPALYQDDEVIKGFPQDEEEIRRPLGMVLIPAVLLPLLLIAGAYLVYIAGNSRELLLAGIAAVSAAAVGIVISIIINMHYPAKVSRGMELKKRSAYDAYLKDRQKVLKEMYEHNRKTMLMLYPDANVCGRFTAASPELWARQPQDHDFLFLRLGLGNRPFQVRITTPDEETGYAGAIRPADIAKSVKTLKNIPLGISLTEHSVIGVISDAYPGGAYSLMQLMLVQTAANHCYTDVKIAAAYNAGSSDASWFEAFRWLPHVWNETKDMRFLASNEKERRELWYELGGILKKRMKALSGEADSETVFRPHYVVFVQNPSLLNGDPASYYLYKYGKQLGFTTILLAGSYAALPDVCTVAAESRGSFQGTCLIKGKVRTPIRFDTVEPGLVIAMAKRMCGYKVPQDQVTPGLPASLTFLDMLGAALPEDIPAASNWRKNRTYESLRAVIGKSAGGTDCCIDLHEKQYGPHGIITGQTGSGRSGMIATMALSLAVRYSPADVSFLIIDMEDNGTESVLKDIPHTAGYLAAPSKNSLRRAAVSLQNESKRRRTLFHEYGVNHIDAYTKLRKNHEAEEIMPHLFIMIDGFDVLKNTEPAAAEELCRLCMAGKGAGLHLITASQDAPEEDLFMAGFRICMGAEDGAPDDEALRRPASEHSSRTGMGMLKLGDEITSVFRAGWCGAPCLSEANSSGSAVLIDLMGREAELQKGRADADARKTQARAVADQLAQLAADGGFRTAEPLWMTELPEKILLDDIPGFQDRSFREGEYNRRGEDFELNVPVGIADYPEMRRRFPVIVDFAKNGSLLLAGEPGSGRSTFLQTLTYGLISCYPPEELNLYIVDYDSRMLASFEDDAHVGGVVTEGMEERLHRLFTMLMGILAERNELLAGRSFAQYRKDGDRLLPAIVLVLDGYEAFRMKTAGAYDDMLSEISGAGENCGMYLAAACAGIGGGGLRLKISHNIRQRICLKACDEIKYGDILETDRLAVIPDRDICGRGLARTEKGILEFQTAIAADAGSGTERGKRIRENCRIMTEHCSSAAMRIPDIPEDPVFEDLRSHPDYQKAIRGKDRLPLGWNSRDASVFTADLTGLFCSLVLGPSRSGKSTYLKNIATAAMDMGGTVWLIDTDSRQERKTAEAAGCGYACDPISRADAVKRLIRVTNERSARRNELMSAGNDDVQTAGIIRQEYAPEFYIITDMAEFLSEIYRDQRGIGHLNPWVENIFAKGRLLNVMIFAAIDTEKVPAVINLPAWHSFIRNRSGMILGGELNRQNVFACSGIPLQEQKKKRAPGTGYAVLSEDPDNALLTVIPRNSKTET